MLVIILSGFMRIIAIKRLKTFWEKGNTDSEQPLKVWYQLFRQNNFSNTNEIKRLFPSWGSLQEGTDFLSMGV